MNLKGFFVAALADGLELSIVTPDDVLRHVTPDLLAAHLPRPLWSRLLTACLGAPKVDAQLVVETIGVPNLCEHLPAPVIWGCLRDTALRALGHEAPATVGEPASDRAAATAATAASITDVVAALENDERATPSASRSRPGTSPRFRQAGSGFGRLTASARRPQASAPAPEPAPRRSATATEAEDLEVEISKDDWKGAIAVDDEQLVDWTSADETVTHGERDDGKR